MTVKYGPAGNKLWAARYNGPSDPDDAPIGLAVDGASNVYVTGASFDYKAGFSDYATVRYDANGNRLWSARYNGPAGLSDSPSGLAADDAAQVYVTGMSFASNNIADYATVKYVQTNVAGFPSVSNQPQGQTVLAGATVTFTVNVSSSTLARYQWRRNGAAPFCAPNTPLSLIHFQAAPTRRHSGGGATTPGGPPSTEDPVHQEKPAPILRPTL